MLYVQIFAAVLVFAGAFFKDRLDSYVKSSSRTNVAKAVKLLYWAAMALTTVAAIAIAFLASSKEERDAATDKCDRARSAFYEGIERKSPALIENAIPALEAARNRMSTVASAYYRLFPELQYRRIAVTHDLALAYERAAYGDSAQGCTYHVEEPGSSPVGCKVHEGSEMYTAPSSLRGGLVRCTDVANTSNWKRSQQAYVDLLRLLEATKPPEADELIQFAGEYASAARSAAYFFICDQLRFGTKHVDQAQKALGLVERLASMRGLEKRRLDAAEKLAFLSALDKSSEPHIDCPSDCTSREINAAPFALLAGEDLKLFTLNNVMYLGQSLVLQPQPSTDSIGEALSPIIQVPNNFSEVVLSWDSTTPPETWLEFYVSVRAGGQWSRFMMGSWSAHDRTRRKSSSKQSNGSGLVDIDTLKLTSPAQALRIEMKMYAKAGAPPPSVRALSVITTSDHASPPRIDPLHYAHYLDAPEQSQMQYPDGGERWCSPTSVSMVLDYWSKQTGNSAWRRMAPDVARDVFDSEYGGNGTGGFGNWSFNVAYANELGRGALIGFVTRLWSLEQVERLTVAGFPVIISARWAAGKLSGAPVTSSDGHLMVVRGFDAKGDVVVNDPAAKGKNGDQIQRTYSRDEFDRAWSGSRRTAYIIHPVTRPLPKDGALGCW